MGRTTLVLCVLLIWLETFSQGSLGLSRELASFPGEVLSATEEMFCSLLQMHAQCQFLFCLNLHNLTFYSPVAGEC